MSLVSDTAIKGPPSTGRDRAAAIAAALRRAARQSRVPVMTISGGGGFRARRSDRLFWRAVIGSFCVIFVVPTIVASIYYGLIASDQYVSEARLALRSGESSLMDSLGGVAGLPASQQYQDSQIIVNYVTSRAMIDRLDSQIGLRRAYSKPDADWWARFDPALAVEDLEKYWRKRVDATIDQQSAIISLHVRAFTAQDSLDIAQKIIDNSEELVNRLAERARGDALSNAKADLARAETRLAEATLAMRDDRNRLGLLSGEATAMMIERVIGVLRLELAHRQQDLAVAAVGARGDAPQVRILNRQIDNLNAQIASYSSEIATTNPNGSATLADRMEQLARRQSELDAAQKIYAGAVVAYESARIDSDTKHGYLMAFMRPTLAQKALYPRRWLNWALIVAPALLIWAVLAGLGALVRDHMA